MKEQGFGIIKNNFPSFISIYDGQLKLDNIIIRYVEGKKFRVTDTNIGYGRITICEFNPFETKGIDLCRVMINKYHVAHKEMFNTIPPPLKNKK